MIDKLQGTGRPGAAPARERTKTAGAQEEKNSFGALLQEKAQAAQGINFSKHAMARAEQRGIELTPDLTDKLADSVEKAREKGATNILAFDSTQAFIINIPYGRVITTMTQEEMKENIFTNIDGAVIL